MFTKRTQTISWSNDKIRIQIGNFMNIYGDKIRAEGWYVYSTSTYTFFVDSTTECEREYPNIRGKERLIQPMERAKIYGFILDEHGFILDYDETAIERNKHLISAIDLNLL